MHYRTNIISLFWSIIFIVCGFISFSYGTEDIPPYIDYRTQSADINHSSAVVSNKNIKSVHTSLPAVQTLLNTAYPSPCTAAYGPNIAVIGDSITADNTYVTWLNRLCSKCQFDNYGVNGETTTKIRQRLRVYEGDKRKKQINLAVYNQIIILAGINNITDPETVMRDLQAMYDLAHRYHVRVIALTLPPWKGYHTWSRRKQRNTDSINTWIRSYPRGVDVVVDIYSLLEDPHTPDMLNRRFQNGDKLHPRGDGQYLIARAILAAAFTDPMPHR